jgi:hypothetical protein
VNDLNSNLNAITAVVNGAIDSSNIANAGVSANNLATALAQMLGVTNVANTGRGATIIATSEARTNTAYGTLTTPDQVAGIVLPTNGIICVLYKATWQESVSGAARAAIFIGATQLARPTLGSTSTVVQEADLGGTATNNSVLTSYPLGLASGANSAGSYTSDVTTGQAVGLAPDTTDTSTTWGGACHIFAAAGTYTISVQFKSSSGSVTAKDRKLYVWTLGF